MGNLKVLQLQHNYKLRSIIPAALKPVNNLELLVANDCNMKYVDALGKQQLHNTYELFQFSWAEELESSMG